MKKYKKIVLGIFIIITLMILVSPSVMAEEIDYKYVCNNKGITDAVRIISYIIQIAKIIVPLIIIILGMVDYFKAVLSNDEKAVNKATSSLIRRIIAGVIVFFIPTLVLGLLNVIEITNGIESTDNQNFGACTKCLFNPNNCP